MYDYIRNKFSFLRWYARMFSNFRDIYAVAQLSNSKFKKNKPKVELHPRALGGNGIYCRPATTDWATFCSAFDDQYHLPPEQCNQFSCIVDLGANVGYTIAHFAYLYPQSKIVAIEMDADNYEMSVENTRRWQDRIVLLHAAIWTADGEVTYNDDAPQDSYRIQVSQGQTPKENTKTVPAISMNKLIERFNIKHIDYLKVDVEGAENELFLSAPLDWLNVVETMKIEIHRAQDLEKYITVIAAAGFTVYKDNHHWSTISAFRTTSLNSQNITV